MFKNFLKSLIAISALSALILPLIPANVEATLVGNTNNAILKFSNSITNPLESGVYKAGTAFSIDIIVDTRSQSVNAVSVIINYPSSLFNVSVDSTGSVFPMEALSTVAGGKITISRGVTGSVNTSNGKVATLNITGLSDTAPASDNFSFDFVAGDANRSNVFLADTQGTAVLSGVYNARFSIDGTPPANVTNFTAAPSSGQISLNWTNPTSDFSGTRILRKTGSSPANYNDGTVVYDSNGTSYIDTGLTNGTTYYYAAFSHDALLNYASGVQVSANPHDTIAPAAITTLSATALTGHTIRLNWTAVGDDNTVGTAVSYDIRYSTAAITAANFSSATQVSGAPTPQVSGSAETITLAGLSGDTTYYFAIKAIDDGSNAGAISNVVNARTYKTADLNNNGIVNAQDFSILLSFWGSTARPPADINQDGYVNTQDFSIMLSQWG